MSDNGRNRTMKTSVGVLRFEKYHISAKIYISESITRLITQEENEFGNQTFRMFESSAG